MKLRVLPAAALTALLMSTPAFAGETLELHKVVRDDCEITLGQRLTSLKSSVELNRIVELCKYQKANTSTAQSFAKTEARDDSPSRFVRWTVNRGRSDGMPEECKSFYCDLEHFRVKDSYEQSSRWIITLPRDRGKPAACRKHHCNSVATESDRGPLINESDLALLMSIPKLADLKLQ